MDKLEELYRRRVSRRTFIATSTAAGAVVLAGCSLGTSDTTPAPTTTVAPTTTPVPTTTPTPTTTPVPTTAPAPPALTDVEVLNFALNLEYLEATFYLYCATGSGLAAADMGPNPGTVLGGQRVAGVTAQQQDILNEFAYAEQQHVRSLRGAIGSSVISMPDLDIINSFNSIAIASGYGSSFSPYDSFANFLLGAFLFEDVGVTAYSGAAPLISAAGVAAGYLNTAIGIQATEAYHAAYLRTSITASAIASGSSTNTTDAADKFAMVRNVLSSGTVTMDGGQSETYLVLPASKSTPSTIVPADANAIAYARTVRQVSNIVYGAVNATAGGFFPSGLNS